MDRSHLGRDCARIAYSTSVIALAFSGPLPNPATAQEASSIRLAEKQETLAEVDKSGFDLFWATADRLAAGQVLSEVDWDDFFAHPGYAITESAAQRRPVIRHCMTAAFAPDGDLDAAKRTLPEQEGRRALVQRLCDHMAMIRSRRAELEAYVADLDGDRLIEQGRLAAAAYLPEGTIDRVETPTVYVLLFERQGFGREGAVVMDALAMKTFGPEQNVRFVAHEFHHVYRDALRTVDPPADVAPLVVALNRLVDEGTASMLDKADYVRMNIVPQGYPTDFLSLVATAPERLAVIDSALARLEESAEGYQAAARVVTRNSPWGGHLNGLYMAMAIEEAFGRDAIADALPSPSAFLISYQRAAAQLGGDRFRFSEDAMKAIRALP